MFTYTFTQQQFHDFKRDKYLVVTLFRRRVSKKKKRMIYNYVDRIMITVDEVRRSTFYIFM